ncbi:tetratricopeptide repeat protein [Pseudoduganella buxea]|nr:SEL1-like repeat protein [Pseudoduganella buxea]GGC00750.1 hypothetical protein GCM10011572_23450 [Pseudoduganella buxea]
MSFLFLCASATGLTRALAEAEKGDIGAMHSVGFHYATGRDVRQDYAQAMTWFQRAALSGQHNSIYSLGIMYRLGQGVDVDMIQAAAWYAPAAKYIARIDGEWIVPRAKVAMYERQSAEVAGSLSASARTEALRRAEQLLLTIREHAATPAAAHADR